LLSLSAHQVSSFKSLYTVITRHKRALHICCCHFPHTKTALSFKSLSTVISHRNAGGRTDFTTGNRSPNLQARFCKLYPANFALFSWRKEITTLGLFCGMRRLYVGLFYAGGTTHFAQGKFKPKSASSILQALPCQFCWLKLSNPSELVITHTHTHTHAHSLCLSHSHAQIE